MLMDLSVECQLLILEKLDVPTLISLTETNKHFFYLVENVLKHRFVNNMIIFETPHTFIDNSTGSINRIQSLQTAKKLLEHFGHLLRNLQVSRYPNINSFDFFPNEFTKPLENVESISLHGQFTRFSNEKLSFHEIFPAMRNLSVSRVNVRDMSWVDHNYPSLEHLSLHIWYEYSEPGYFNPLIVERLLQNNPQIRSLILENASRKMLSCVADKLLNLDILELRVFNNFELDGAPITLHFDNLKVLKMHRCIKSIPIDVTFSSLEEFQTDGYPRKCKKWIEFIERSENLKKLRITQPIDNTDVSQLSTSHSNIFEVYLMCGEDVKADTIIKFIKNGKQLRKIQLVMPSEVSVSFMVDVFEKCFGMNWTIKAGLNNISLHRKNY